MVGLTVCFSFVKCPMVELDGAFRGKVVVVDSTPAMDPQTTASFRTASDSREYRWLSPHPPPLGFPLFMLKCNHLGRAHKDLPHTSENEELLGAHWDIHWVCFWPNLTLLKADLDGAFQPVFFFFFLHFNFIFLEIGLLRGETAQKWWDTDTAVMGYPVLLFCQHGHSLKLRAVRRRDSLFSSCRPANGNWF